MRSFLVVFAASACLCTISNAQDQQQPTAAPSLGDYARQVRLKKQRKDAQAKPAPAKEIATNDADAGSVPDSAPKSAHVASNEDASEPVAASTPAHRATGEPQQATGGNEAQGEKWKSQILGQKNAIASLQHEITGVSNSIHFAGGNCVANCEKWNEHQQQNQQEVETMKAQLEEMQKRLEEMQDTARKQGYGSAVYDP
jgi:hypothetical protein